MARGLAKFDGSALTNLRRGAITGKSVTAQELANMVGATKAQILAYEAGRVIPDAPRIRALAAVFDVPPLYLCGGGSGFETIADLRRACGYNAKEVASALRLSAKSYRRFEHEGIVPRRRLTLPDELAELLHVRFALLERILLRSPGVQARTLKIQEILDGLRSQYVMTNGTWSPPDGADPLVLELAELVSRSQLMVLKVVRYVLEGERVSRLRLFESDLTATLHPDPDRRQRAASTSGRHRVQQSRFSERVGANLEAFFRQALPRDVVDLMIRVEGPEVGSPSVPLSAVSRALLAEVPPRLVMVIPRSEGAHLELTHDGMLHLYKFHRWYSVVYPRLKFPESVRFPTRYRGPARPTLMTTPPPVSSQ